MDKRLWIAIAVLLVVLMASSAYAVKTGAVPSDETEMQYARRVLARIWQKYGYVLTVTAGRDGTHMAQSKHYLGLAEDYRTRGIPADTLARMIDEARRSLGSDYDVVNEDDHLHVEYDPK